MAKDDSEQEHPASKLIGEWLADDSGYDEATWPTIYERIIRNRERIGLIDFDIVKAVREIREGE